MDIQQRENRTEGERREPRKDRMTDKSLHEINEGQLSDDDDDDDGADEDDDGDVMKMLIGAK